MIGLVKSTFFEIKESSITFPKIHLCTEEMILKSFKSIDICAFFTNKRIIFTKLTSISNELEIEYVPYRTIQRFTFLDSNKLKSYTIELTLPELILFFSTDIQSDAFSFKKLLDEYIK